MYMYTVGLLRPPLHLLTLSTMNLIPRQKQRPWVHVANRPDIIRISNFRFPFSLSLSLSPTLFFVVVSFSASGFSGCY
ncbi:hypothetical protein BDZ94DRAFT_1276310 [Collybia nuda]|uniref:Uncharacterized protein n=1 Tax=Collybia nuda TaxID=64659 RepID=A0A9P5XSI2_9AGAR|nr:hypothetical protein BDZ94DRAFT_1276310 [Collybia nuda]